MTYYSSNPLKAGNYVVSWKQEFEKEFTPSSSIRINIYAYDYNNTIIPLITNWSTYNKQSQRFNNFKISPTVDLNRIYLEIVLFGTTSTISDAQIEKGTISTEYKSFQEPLIENIYLDEPLRKLGDTYDYIDFETGKIIRNIEVIDNSNTKTIEESFRKLDSPIKQDIIVPNINILTNNTNLTTNTNVKGNFVYN